MMWAAISLWSGVVLVEVPGVRGVVTNEVV